MERSSSANARLFWSIFPAVIVLDVITKLIAFVNLPERVPQLFLGQDWLRFTLVYNRGAAFGLHLGHDAVTRVVFTVLTFVALVILWKLFRETRESDRMRVLAVALVCGGAVGNLVDRLRWSRGVVDFIDVGVGAARWPTFNIADMAVTTGAVVLAVVLWRDERVEADEKREERESSRPGASLSESGGESAI